MWVIIFGHRTFFFSPNTALKALHICVRNYKMYNKLARRGIRNKENDKTYNELPVDHFNILKVKQCFLICTNLILEVWYWTMYTLTPENRNSLIFYCLYLIPKNLSKFFILYIECKYAIVDLAEKLTSALSFLCCALKWKASPISIFLDCRCMDAALD